VDEMLEPAENIDEGTEQEMPSVPTSLDGLAKMQAVRISQSSSTIKSTDHSQEDICTDKSVEYSVQEMYGSATCPKEEKSFRKAARLSESSFISDVYLPVLQVPDALSTLEHHVETIISDFEATFDEFSAVVKSAFEEGGSVAGRGSTQPINETAYADLLVAGRKKVCSAGDSLPVADLYECVTVCGRHNETVSQAEEDEDVAADKPRKIICLKDIVQTLGFQNNNVVETDVECVINRETNAVNNDDDDSIFDGLSSVQEKETPTLLRSDPSVDTPIINNTPAARLNALSEALKNKSKKGHIIRIVTVDALKLIRRSSPQVQSTANKNGLVKEGNLKNASPLVEGEIIWTSSSLPNARHVRTVSDGSVTADTSTNSTSSGDIRLEEEEATDELDESIDVSTESVCAILWRFEEAEKGKDNYHPCPSSSPPVAKIIITNTNIIEPVNRQRLLLTKKKNIHFDSASTISSEWDFSNRSSIRHNVSEQRSSSSRIQSPVPFKVHKQLSGLLKKKSVSRQLLPCALVSASDAINQHHISGLDDESFDFSGSNQFCGANSSTSSSHERPVKTFASFGNYDPPAVRPSLDERKPFEAFAPTEEKAVDQAAYSKSSPEWNNPADTAWEAFPNTF
jgi:hypothetical protein